jgi:peptidoglycan hydrolase FlgJ
MLNPSTELSLLSLRASPAQPNGRLTNEGARKSAEEFETMFLSQMLNTMTEGVGEESEFSGGSSESTWRSFFNQAAAEQMIAKGGIGLAPRLMADIIAMQASASQSGAE